MINISAPSTLWKSKEGRDMNFDELLVYLRERVKEEHPVKKKINIDKKRTGQKIPRKRDPDYKKYPIVMYLRTTQKGFDKLHKVRASRGSGHSSTLNTLFNEMIENL